MDKELIINVKDFGAIRLKDYIDGMTELAEKLNLQPSNDGILIRASNGESYSLIYTECFVEFESIDNLKNCIKYLDSNVDYWDYDAYGIYKSQPHRHYTDCKVDISDTSDENDIF